MSDSTEPSREERVSETMQKVSQRRSTLKFQRPLQYKVIVEGDEPETATYRGFLSANDPIDLYRAISEAEINVLEDELEAIREEVGEEEVRMTEARFDEVMGSISDGIGTIAVNTSEGTRFWAIDFKVREAASELCRYYREQHPEFEASEIEVMNFAGRYFDITMESMPEWETHVSNAIADILENGLQLPTNPFEDMLEALQGMVNVN